jgi:MFS family permease
VVHHPTEPESQRRTRTSRLFARITIDLSPLRTSRDYRLLFTGSMVSFIGSMVTYITVPFQVKELTGSLVAVGLLGAAELVPLVLFGLYGGALADVVDRRRMVLLSEAGLCLLSALLLINALLPNPQVWPLYVGVALIAALDGLQRPSLEALVPRLLAPEQLPAAAALSSLRGNVGMIAGPAIGGLVATTFGVAAAYALDVMTFAASLVALFLMRAVPPLVDGLRPSLRGIAQGLRYAWGRRELLGTYAVDLSAMFFAMPTALFPFLADDLGAPWALGLLYSAGSVGSLAATLTSGWTSHVHRHGRWVVYAAAAWGGSIALAGLTSDVVWALVFLAMAGAADMVSGLFRLTIWNQTIPDELRGRLAGIELLSYSIGPVLGQSRAGMVAAATSVRTSIVSGGILCIAATALLAAALPALWRYDERTSPHAIRERALRAKAASADGSRAASGSS